MMPKEEIILLSDQPCVVENPRPSPQAFHEAGYEPALTQAAVLLLLSRIAAARMADASTVQPGRRLAGAFRRDQGRRKGTALDGEGETVMAPLLPDVSKEDLAAINLPPWSYQGERWTAAQTKAFLMRRHSVQLPGRDADATLLGHMADDLYEQPTSEKVAALGEVALQHRYQVVRVAAAAALWPLCVQKGRLIQILFNGARSPQRLVRDLSLACLLRWCPDHPLLRRLRTPFPEPEPTPAAKSSILVHGTFAQNASWWQPGGDFFGYLAGQNSIPRPYGAVDQYSWSGAYSHQGREIAAQELADWLGMHSATPAHHDPLWLLGHSHGANVAMRATHLGPTKVDNMVLLSCPVYSEYLPEFERVGKVVSIRGRLDWVILIDGGGQRFQHPQIVEHVLPVWFDHSATHTPEIWERYNVSAKL
jgi:pimeloyl-ACP methyl ester carboxylesterase